MCIANRCILSLASGNLRPLSPSLTLAIRWIILQASIFLRLSHRRPPFQRLPTERFSAAIAMDTKVERTKTNRKMEGLRTRVGTKMEDEDECQSTQKSFGRSSRIKTAQDDLAKGMEGAQPFKSDGSPTLTPGMSTPKSMSPSPPANGCLANFGVIIPGVYRSAWPTADGYEFMRGLRLKTIMYVSTAWSSLTRFLFG